MATLTSDGNSHSISLNANANDIKTLQKQLKPWQPLEITNKNNSLTVVLPGKILPAQQQT